MGIVIRQSFFTTLISYLGMAIGYLNLLYLYPLFLDLDQIGLLRTILDAALLLSPFAQMGLTQAIIRYYPSYAMNEKDYQGFFNLMFLFCLVGYGILVSLCFVFKDALLSFFQERAEIINHYLPLILLLVFLMMVISLLEAVSRARLNLVFPKLLSEISIRAMQSIMICLYFLNWISFETLLSLLLLIYGLNLCVLVGYLMYQGNFKTSIRLIKIPFKQLSGILIYGAINLINAAGTLVIGKIDSLMVSALIDFKANALYTTAFFMATAIEVPKRALSQANSTLIARAFQNNELHQVHLLYQKTSINQLIIGSLLAIGLWVNLDSIYELMPKGELYAMGFKIVYLIGIAKLVDMTFGPNGEILIMSKYYWINTLILIIMIFLAVGLNYILIPSYGIEGAAYATAITYIVTNFIRFLVVLLKLQIQPFSKKTILVLFISAFTLAVGSFLPQLDWPILDLIYRSTLVSIVFVSLILITKPSPEINGIFFKTLSILKSLRRNKP